MRLGKLAIALFLGLSLAGWANAQRGGGFGFGGGNNIVNQLETSESLQKELKIDKDTLEKVKQAITKAREDTKDESDKLRDRNLTREERADIRKKIDAAYDKAVSGVLSADQMKRLHQIENQQLHLALFEKDDVKKTLKLTSDQQEQIKDINDALNKDIDAAGGGRGRGGRGGFGGFGGDPETQKKIAALRKDAMDRVTKALSESQNAALKDMLGASFDLPQGGFGGFDFASMMQKAGQLFSQNAKDRLELTDEQKKQLEDLQKEVDAKIGKILTDKQKDTLKEMQTNPFGGRGFGPPGGGRGGNN